MFSAKKILLSNKSNYQDKTVKHKILIFIYSFMLCYAFFISIRIKTMNKTMNKTISRSVNKKEKSLTIKLFLLHLQNFQEMK